MKTFWTGAILIVIFFLSVLYLLRAQKPIQTEPTKTRFEIIKYPVFKKVETITLPDFEVEHDTKQVTKMGWAE